MDHQMGTDVEIDIDTSGDLTIPHPGSIEMDPDLKKTDPIPGFNSNRKQNMENLPEEKDQTIRRTSIGTNSDNDDDF